jgi:hypothetical protein
MKIFKTFLFVILIIGFIQGNLYSRIESRVCGIVKDSENGQVLKDVNVYLVIYNEDDPEVNENDQTAVAKTDKDGYFEINDVYKGKYFVMCEKSGYMTVNPLHLAQEQNPEDYLPIFFIDEGEIKHFDIKMKRGGSLKVTVQKKDINGIFGINESDCWISKKSKSKDPETGEPYLVIVSSRFTDSNGVSFFDGLEPGEEYDVSIMGHELPKREKKAIIKVNETVELNFIFDLTDATGIKGEISYREDKTPEFTSVGLRLVMDGKYRYITDLNITGKSDFLITNLTPGTYLLLIANSYIGEDGITGKKILVKIKSGETSLVKISF